MIGPGGVDLNTEDGRIVASMVSLAGMLIGACGLGPEAGAMPAHMLAHAVEDTEDFFGVEKIRDVLSRMTQAIASKSSEHLRRN